jgi:exodeoxyribonuclease VII small subunit
MTENSDTIPNFEKSLAELEALVEKLESGELALDESLADFKRGVELTRECQTVLTRAQQTVQKLLDPENEESAEPFLPYE